jgi:hypothetical protein
MMVFPGFRILIRLRPSLRELGLTVTGLFFGGALTVAGEGSGAGGSSGGAELKSEAGGGAFSDSKESFAMSGAYRLRFFGRADLLPVTRDVT